MNAGSFLVSPTLESTSMEIVVTDPLGLSPHCTVQLALAECVCVGGVCLGRGQEPRSNNTGVFTRILLVNSGKM